MSKNQENKKLKDRIEDLEFIKDFQQDIIADFGDTTVADIAKKFLPDALLREVEKKKRDLIRLRTSTRASEQANKLITKD
jgi:uncharacterized coiled-coil protein SlyX